MTNIALSKGRIEEEFIKTLIDRKIIKNEIVYDRQLVLTIDNLKIITNQLIQKEQNYREQINRIKLEDICMRALGVLKNARILSSSEMMTKLSEVKLGISMGIIKSDVSPIKLIIEGQPYMIMRKFGNIDTEERDIERAKIIREALN
jgi:protein arginine kinase